MFDIKKSIGKLTTTEMEQIIKFGKREDALAITLAFLHLDDSSLLEQLVSLPISNSDKGFNSGIFAGFVIKWNSRNPKQWPDEFYCKLTSIYDYGKDKYTKVDYTFKSRICKTENTSTFSNISCHNVLELYKFESYEDALQVAGCLQSSMCNNENPDVSITVIPWFEPEDIDF